MVKAVARPNKKKLIMYSKKDCVLCKNVKRAIENYMDSDADPDLLEFEEIDLDSYENKEKVFETIKNKYPYIKTFPILYYNDMYYAGPIFNEVLALIDKDKMAANAFNMFFTDALKMHVCLHCREKAAPTKDKLYLQSGLCSKCFGEYMTKLTKLMEKERAKNAEANKA